MVLIEREHDGELVFHAVALYRRGADFLGNRLPFEVGFHHILGF